MRRTDPEFALGPGTVVASADGARSTGPAHTPPPTRFQIEKAPGVKRSETVSALLIRNALRADG